MFFGVLIIALTANGDITAVLFEAPGFFYAAAFRILGFFFCICMICAFAGIGFWAERLLCIRSKYSEFYLLICFFAGYAFAAVIVYVLGFAQLLHSWIFVSAAVIGFISFCHRTKLASIKRNCLDLKKSWIGFSAIEKITWVLLVVFLLSRLLLTLHYNSFGDPLYYSLPVGKDYLNAGGFAWMDYEIFFTHAGLADFVLIYFHSICENSMLMQISAQTFYFLLGPVLLFYIFHFKLFSRLIPQKHSLWISFSLICINHLKLESIVAKPDYLLAVIFCLIITVLFRILTQDGKNISLSLWKTVLLLGGLCFPIKTTSVFFLVPLSVSILIVCFRIIPWSNREFRRFLFFIPIFSSLNLLKNYFISDNPIFPFANGIFHSPYWDEVGTRMLADTFSFATSGLMDFILAVGRMYLGNPTACLFLVVGFLGIMTKRSSSDSSSKELRRLLLLMAICWVGCLFFWYQFLGPDTYSRFIAAVIFLSYLIIFVAIVCFFPVYFHKNRRLPIIIGYISLLLSISISNVDARLLKTVFSNQAFKDHWLNSSVGIGELQNYLNSKNNRDLRVLVYDRGQKFHAKYLVYGSRPEDPRLRFVYSNSHGEIQQGLKNLDVDYYALWKEFTEVPNELMTQRTYLEKEFQLEMDFRRFIVFKIEKE